ncbi:hypothetical protein M0R45_021064 [Rubus argutus]|uniref:Uncharacterized protein n=1 Tax=Rubus argutus TaxID=59490 RepID=A0AAW1XBF2_RUBAR
MGVFTYETEFTSVIPPPRLFRLLFLMLTTSSPRLLHKQLKALRLSKEMAGLELSRRLTLVKGVNTAINYHCKGEVEIKEEHVKAGKERAAGLFKIIESHLLANPDAYN